jgi:hypothetical protein
LFEEVGGVAEQLHYVMDLDLWLRLADRTRLHLLPVILSSMRYHPLAKTFRHNDKVYEEVLTVLEGYRNRMSPRTYHAAIRAAKRKQGQAFCRQGLDSYFGGERVAAARLAFQAMKKDPAVCVSREWVGLIARLVLPNAVRTQLFLKP